MYKVRTKDPSMLRLRLVSFLSLVLALGCSAAPTGPGPNPVDGGGLPIPDNCDPNMDTDGDGIADAIEGVGFDFDGDGIPNEQDTDADNDGIPDSEEAGIGPCFSRDTDGDMKADWLDIDADNDGLLDRDEVMVYGTDPQSIDSDGDGVTDLGEVEGTNTDPNDAASTIDPDDFFVLLPYGTQENRTLTFSTNIDVADVYMLIDTTGSMQSTIDNVRSSLTRIATEVATEIENVQIGVGDFRDFPYTARQYGQAGDYPFRHRQDVTANIDLVQAAIAPLAAGGGYDQPESMTEALFRIAAGVGQRWTFPGGSTEITYTGCQPQAGDTGARIGFACFREGALPIVVAVTDAPTHEGQGGSAGYTGLSPVGTSFDIASSALSDIGARVVGVSVSDPRGDFAGTDDLTDYARATGTVDGDGNALVSQASGGNVSDSVIDAIRTLVQGVPQDVTRRLENVDGNPDNIDATRFIKAVRPNATIPAGGATSMDDRTFYHVTPGTEVEFTVEFDNDFRMPNGRTEIFRAQIIVVGNGVADLDVRQVYIVVPPDGQTILI